MKKKQSKMLFTCGTCGRDFKTESWRDRHVILKHPETVGDETHLSNEEVTEELKSLVKILELFDGLTVAGKNWLRSKLAFY